MKPRSLNSPRVREVLAVFDRFVASPARQDNPSLVDGFMHVVVHSPLDRFSAPFVRANCPWSVDAIRAILIAYLVHAPAVDFRAMCIDAARQRRWLEEFEQDPEGDGRGYSLVPIAGPQCKAPESLYASIERWRADASQESEAA